MANARDVILDWAEQGHIAPANLRAAMTVGRALPTAAEWRAFLDQLLLFMGAVLLGAGVIFFFAFNWQDLGRFAKFALVEVPIVVALLFVWRLGFDTAAGKATLVTASLLVGALLALVGQTYQTGADTFELFAVWAAAILPWTLLARLPALWILWLMLVNLAVSLYFATMGLFGILFAPEALLWVLFALNTMALAVWEWLAANGVTWLRERWAVRLLATAGGALITWLAANSILESSRTSPWTLPVWLLWLAVVYFVYRRHAPDLFVLAGAVLSVVIMAAVVVGNFVGSGAGSLLLIGMIVIGLSAAGGWWLKQVAAEEDDA